MPFPRSRATSWQAGSTARLSWQFDSDCFPMTIQKPTTLQEAKSIARHLGSLYAKCALAIIA